MKTNVTNINPVILWGGGGIRLWPRSREATPKPFLPLFVERTLFQATLYRCSDRNVFESPLVAAGAQHTKHIEEQASLSSEMRLVVEPAARNTAPAIAKATSLLPKEAAMLVCPNDHHIGDLTAFEKAIKKGAALAETGHMVTLGITPDSLENRFEYRSRQPLRRRFLAMSKKA